MTLGAVSHVGQRRDANEDAFLAVASGEAPLGAAAFVAVADGMGGHRAGEVASAMAVQSLVERLGREGISATLAQGGEDGVPLLREVEMVNAEVYEAGTQPDLQGMGTTLTAALLVGRHLYLAHVGDTRAYLLRKRRLRRLTRDHSWVEEQIDAGLLSPAEADGHPGRNLLTRAIGIAPIVEIDSMAVQMEPGDMLLLCSDGLHSLVTDEEMTRVLARQTPQKACETLVSRANARGGNDNITAVVLRLDHLPEEAVHDKDSGGSQPSGPGSLGKALDRISRAVARKRDPQAGSPHDESPG